MKRNDFIEGLSTMIASNSKLSVVKAIYDLCKFSNKRLGLKESKELVDEYFYSNDSIKSAEKIYNKLIKLNYKEEIQSCPKDFLFK